MLIGIDTSRTTKPKLTGTEYYSVEIIKQMLKIDSYDRFLLYSQLDPTPRLGKMPVNARIKLMPFPKLWTQIRLSWEMLFRRPDVLFVPAHTIPIVHPKNTVVTLHDLGFKHFPELYSPKELLYHNWSMNHGAGHAKLIITPSEFTKKDLIKTYGIDPIKIRVIWHGYDRASFVYDPNAKKKPYIFYIGRIEEKKNSLGMIKAYGLLRKEKSITHQLILAGAPGFGFEKIKAEIESLPPEIQKDIKILGYVSQEKYIELLQEADIFLFTTFFEGFGMPIVEAFACGTPVVTSNVTSMPEIAGDAALLVDPKKPLGIAAALSRLIHSSALKKQLIIKGRARAKLFSWEEAAEKTLAVIHEAGSK